MHTDYACSALFSMIQRRFAISVHFRPVLIILQLNVVSAPSLLSLGVADRGRVALATSVVRM